MVRPWSFNELEIQKDVIRIRQNISSMAQRYGNANP